MGLTKIRSSWQWSNRIVAYSTQILTNIKSSNYSTNINERQREYGCGDAVHRSARPPVVQKVATKQNNPKCLLSKEINYKANKTHILQNSPTFSLVHDPQNAVVTDRIGESFRTNQRKQKEMSAQWLGLTQQLNHSSRKIVYGYRQQHGTYYLSHSLREQSNIISK